jgi:hypothetical protein
VPGENGYTPGDRVGAAVVGLVLAAVVVLMADIALNGRLSARFGRPVADEAERITREAADA